MSGARTSEASPLAVDAAADAAPLLPEVGLLALPNHSWDSYWMTPHHVLVRLARYLRVVWLEPAPHWRAVRARPDSSAASHAGETVLPAGFELCRAARWLPDVYRPPALRDWLLQRRVASGWRRLDAAGCRTRVLHLWNPRFSAALERGRHDLSLYHIDDEYSYAVDAPAIGTAEAQVLARVDQVFVVSPGLMTRKANINARMTLAPEGVDYALYSRRAAEPDDLAGVPRPRIGYTGHVKRQLDWTLLLGLAKGHPEWSFVFVGPRTLPDGGVAEFDALERLPNVHFLGAKTLTDLARYPQHFDVCVMPYLVNAYTNCIYPLKLHEYLASGTPVVGTPIRTLLDFADAIGVATGIDAWSAALDAALRSPIATVAASRFRQQIAQRHDWSAVVRHIAATICDRLGDEYRERLDRLDPIAAVER